MSLIDLYELQPLQYSKHFNHLVIYPSGTGGYYILSTLYKNDLRKSVYNDHKIKNSFQCLENDYFIDVGGLNYEIDYSFDVSELSSLNKRIKRTISRFNSENNCLFKSNSCHSHFPPFISTITFNLTFEKTIIIKYKNFENVWKSRFLTYIKHFNSPNLNKYKKRGRSNNRNDYNKLCKISYQYLNFDSPFASLYLEQNNTYSNQSFKNWFKEKILFNDEKSQQLVYNWHKSDFYERAKEIILNKSNNVEEHYWEDYQFDDEYKYNNQTMIDYTIDYLKG